MIHKTLSKVLYLAGYVMIIAIVLLLPKQFLNPCFGKTYLLLFVVAYWGLFKLLVIWKRRRFKEIVDDLSITDKEWSFKKIESRVRRTMNDLTRSKVYRKPVYVQHCLSETMYKKYELYIDKLTKEGRKNVIEQVEIIDISPVELDDYEDDAKDSFSVCVKYKAIDYMLDESTGLLISGDCNKKLTFIEVWKFSRTSKNWMLDAIDGDVEIAELLSSTNVLKDC